MIDFGQGFKDHYDITTQVIDARDSDFSPLNVTSRRLETAETSIEIEFHLLSSVYKGSRSSKDRNA